MEFGKRLKTLRLSAGFTQRNLAGAAGVSVATVQFWENGTKSPSMHAIISLSEALGVSADMLLGLSAPAFSISVILSKTEKALLEDFRLLDAHGRHLVRTVCSMEKNRVQKLYEQDALEEPRVERFIPHYTTPSAAGISVPLDGSDFEMMLVTNEMPNEADCAVNIQGESMAPYIHDGDMVYVRKDAELAVGDIGIFCVDGAMYCKLYYPEKDGSLLLVSTNPELRHTNIHITADGGQSVTVYGKVLLGHRAELPSYLFE